MADAVSSLNFSSRAYFREIYSLVADAVFLYNAADMQIIEGNRFFRSLINAPEDLDLNLPLAQIFNPLSIQQLTLPRKLFDAEIRGANKALLPVRIQLREVLLEGMPLLMGVASRQLVQPVSEASMAAAEQEKKALLNEVYHRVKNNLNVIISLISLQLNRVHEPQPRRLLKESKSRIYTLALLQERLYHSPRLSDVKANEYLTSLAQSVVATFKESRQQIRLIPQTQESWLNVDLLVPLGLIVHELVANAVLHAYAEQETGDIQLMFNICGASEYELVISDEGRGLPEGSVFASFKTLGAQLVISLTKQLKGRLQVESSTGKGTKVSVKFYAKT